LLYLSLCFLFFFFQAEDGIRDFHVTGVQTCALPISDRPALDGCEGLLHLFPWRTVIVADHPEKQRNERTELECLDNPGVEPPARSEERRVGKECRSRWTTYQ